MGLGTLVDDSSASLADRLLNVRTWKVLFRGVKLSSDDCLGRIAHDAFLIRDNIIGKIEDRERERDKMYEKRECGDNAVSGGDWVVNYILTLL